MIKYLWFFYCVYGGNQSRRFDFLSFQLLVSFKYLYSLLVIYSMLFLQMLPQSCRYPIPGWLKWRPHLPLRNLRLDSLFTYSESGVHQQANYLLWTFSLVITGKAY